MDDATTTKQPATESGISRRRSAARKDSSASYSAKRQEIAEAAVRVAEAAYRFGERGILDVLDAQRVLRSARLNLLEARFQVQSARIELETLAGRFAAPPTALSTATPSNAIQAPTGQ